MKAFNDKLNKIIDVNKLEDLNDHIVLISESQENDIINSLSNDGVVFIRNGRLIISGPKVKDHVYNKESESWVFSKEVKDKRVLEDREKAWEIIKIKRAEAQRSGVYIGMVNKWFHTDDEAQRNYLFLKLIIDYEEFVPIKWKCMDGSYVDMTPELYKQIVMKSYVKAQLDFKNAELLYSEVLKSDDPLNVDLSKGWTPRYNGILN